MPGFQRGTTDGIVRAFVLLLAYQLVDINIGRLLDGECDGSCNGIGFDCGIGERFERFSRADIGDVSDQFTLDRARADNRAANIRPSLLPKAFAIARTANFVPQ